ncbi:MAG TPA: type II secretion system protein [Phycisphaerae bacterium]|nr:type II secretion system protein [Phycisphaerae bacterium]HNU44340.1 type II secretion system protein [Phycisphaerae bacterium]
MRRTARKNAFSLVELVIVVVIIGMIAAIAVPRISRGAKGAAESSVRGSLASLRNAIDLYAAEHGGTFPGSDGDADTFKDQLLKKTNAGGETGSDANEHIYGPYLRGSDLPPLQVGPNKGATGLVIANTGPAVDEATKTAGWVYNYATGDIIANTDDEDEAGVGYDTY